jgi:hypothetical protein
LSGRPAAEPPVDLLRPRNIYAVVLVTVAVFLTASAAGWSPRSSTPPGAVPTGGVSASTSSPTATPTPAPTTLTVSPPATCAPVALSTPTPSPTPAPTPTISQLAAAYVDAATTFDKANRGALAAWASSARTLMDAKRRAKACAAAELAFVRAVQRIPWYGDYKTLTRRVLTDRQPAICLAPLREDVHVVDRLQHELEQGRCGHHERVGDVERASNRA